MIKYRSASPRVRLFQNDLLERMTLVSPLSFAIIWSAFLTLALYASWGANSLPASIGLVVIGVTIWILFEYAMHRFFFHVKLRSDLGRHLIFLTHGNHHAMPGDPQRNIMPPLVSVGISCMIWLLLWSAFGASGSVIFLGFGIGYVVYDTIHYACHQLPMRGPLLSRLRRHHIRHHCGDEEGNYAITAIFLDRIFGTDTSRRR
jgi:sterol desaturase/sphingolipid hydroxylase (fatty acid hydroxylase superfamily)